jgi:hypothetical protein
MMGWRANPSNGSKLILSKISNAMTYTFPYRSIVGNDECFVAKRVPQLTLSKAPITLDETQQHPKPSVVAHPLEHTRHKRN